MKLNKRLILSLCFAALAAAAFADFTPVKPEIVSSRLNAMGGANPALTGRGTDTLSTNPAALAFEEKTMRIIGLETIVSGPFSDALKILAAAVNGESTENIEDAIIDSIQANNGVYFGANIMGPLSVAYVSKNFGFGIFNRTYATADVADTESVDFSLGEELLVTGGFGVKVIDTRRHELALGIQGKLFVQADATESGATTISLDDLPTNSAIGAGFDIGLLYRFAASFSVGVVCKDAYTAVFYGEHNSIHDLVNMDRVSTGNTTLDRDLQVGIAWHPHLPRNWHTITGFTFAAGMSDLLNVADVTERNPVLNVSVGAEVVFFNILSLRAGLYETYPALGMGINIKNTFQIDMAFYGRELGYEPGERPVYNIALGMGFGF